MGFFSSFKSSFSETTINKKSKNRFEGTVHTPPPVKTSKDIEDERFRKFINSNKDIFEVMADDEETEDLERLIKTYNMSYGKQQSEFRSAVLKKYETVNGTYICAHCGREFTKDQIHADHVIPRSQGGSFSIVNGQVLCSFCNHSKKNDISDVDDDLISILEDDKERNDDLKEFANYLVNSEEFKNATKKNRR